MRWALRITSIVLLAGCASASKEPEACPDYEKRLEELLKLRPDDPDLLFLRHDHKDLARCKRLAELKPTPVILASVVSKHLSAGMNEENLPDLERLLGFWQQCEPENAMPVILQGQIRLSRGNLTAGIETLLRATRLPTIHMYNLEAQQESLRIQKQEGLDDIFFLGAVIRDNIELSNVVRGVSRLLRAMSTWEFLDGNTESAFRKVEADYRLARLFERDARTNVEGITLDLLAPYSAERMCELALMNQDRQSAVQFAALAREVWLANKGRIRASKRYLLADPVTKAMQDVGMLEGGAESSEEEDLDKLMERFLALSMALHENWEKNKDRFNQALNERSALVRRHLETQIGKGYLAAASECLTNEDKIALESLKPPIDRFMEMREDFYPATFGPSHRNRLVELLTAEGPEDEWELREFLQERAASALIFHKDKDAIPLIRRAKDRSGAEFNGLQAVVVIVALGDRVDPLGEGFREMAGCCNPAAAWAAARLRVTELIPDFLMTLSTETGPSHITFSYAEPVIALLALRQMTGQQFGFDSDKWVDWGKTQGYWKN